jgi:5-methylcytosine-specific restriction endonuclease McrA
MRSGQMRKIDNLFSKVVRQRDKQCQRCGTTENLQCSHVLPRTFISVRWNPENAIALCYRCHIYWWHKYPHEAVAWFDAKWPGRYQAMRDITNLGIKTKPDEEYKKLKELV